MSTELQGKLLPLEVDFTGAGSTYKTLICLQNFDYNLDVPIDVQETDCGQISSPGNPGVNVTLTCVEDLAPGGTQASFKEVHDAALAGTKVKVRVQNPVVGAVLLGTRIFSNFDAYFSNVTLNKRTTGPVTFSATLQSSGTIDGTV